MSQLPFLLGGVRRPVYRRDLPTNSGRKDGRNMATLVLENYLVLESFEIDEEDLKLLKKKEPSKREVINSWQE